MAELGSFRHNAGPQKTKIFFETTPCKVAGANVAAHFRLKDRISDSSIGGNVRRQFERRALALCSASCHLFIRRA
jgi:hypothetical protein